MPFFDFGKNVSNFANYRNCIRQTNGGKPDGATKIVKTT